MRLEVLSQQHAEHLKRSDDCDKRNTWHQSMKAQHLHTIHHWTPVTPLSGGGPTTSLFLALSALHKDQGEGFWISMVTLASNRPVFSCMLR